MRKLRIFALLLLSLALALTLISCGEPCTSHTDADSDGKCDNCGAEVKVCEEHKDEDGDEKCDDCGATVEKPPVTSTDPMELTLIENGKAKFRIVTGKDIPSATRKSLDKFIEGMRDLGIKFDCVDYLEEVEDDGTIEIIIGTVPNRGEAYNIDMHTLGEEGYIISSFGNKILILGGTEEGTGEAFEKFIKDYIGYDSKTESIDTVTIGVKKWKYVVQTKFKIESITLKGEPINDYTIAVDSSEKVYLEAAKSIQSTFYSRAGIWLEIVSPEEATEKSIVFKNVEIGEAGAKGFRIFVEGTQLVVECAHDNMLDQAVEAFIGKILYASGEFKFGSNYLFEHEISKIYYEDFGVKGDGRTDDYQAIKDAHDFANEGGQDVFGKAGATYYIQSTKGRSGSHASIVIQTNTNWCGAKFIIDDTNVGYGDGGNYSTNIFAITSSLKAPSITKEQLDAINAAGGITYGATNVGLKFDYPVMLTLRTSDNKVYIRYGGNANAGSDQHELIVVDKDGNIDPSTPLLFEYPHLTGITVERLDETPIVVQGATFESLASKVNLVTEYYSISRGIAISRPNVTVKNLVHIITGEIPKYAVVDKDSNILEGYTRDSNGVIKDPSGKVVTDGHAVGFIGHSFGGFITVSNTSDVLIDSVTFQARMYYLQGTYDIGCGTANNVVFKNCDQSNFFYTNSAGQELPNVGSPCWGVAGTNYCKNLIYDNSKLARYDAHSGVTNGKIINGSEISSFRLIGGGEFLVENSTIWFYGGSSIVQLREDYGSTFKGHLIFKDVTVKSVAGRSPTAIAQGPSANHWFGYTTYFPNITIDNVKIENARAEIDVMLNSTFNPDAQYPYRGISIENIHKGDVPFEDTNCDKCYLKESEHLEHHEFVDTDTNKKCDTCQSGIERHRHDMVDKDNNGVCDDCLVVANKHSHSFADTDGNYSCDVCGKRDQDHVETHAFVDANNNKECDTCKKVEDKHEHDFVDNKNLNPYIPPEFIEVKNNDANGYQVYIVSYPFWENTDLRGNITVKQPAQ